MGQFVRRRNLLLGAVGIVGLFAAAHVLLAVLIEYKFVDATQESVGARVDVQETQVSLLTGRLSLRDVQIANPQSPLRNLVTAERCEMELEPGSLLYKRAVIRQGAVTGLRFGTERETSGYLADFAGQDATALDGWLDPESSKAAQEWLDRLHERFDRNLVEQLESIRLTEELLARWPAESATLAKRVAALRERTTELDAKVVKARENPLRNVEFLESLPAEVTTIRAELTAISRELGKLPNLADTDRRAIVAARIHDEKLLKDELHFDSIDTNVLSAYLLQQQMHGPLGDLVGWLRWARRVIPGEQNVVKKGHKRRGHDVLFPGCARSPDLLVRTLQLQGTARLGGQPLEIVGTLDNLSDKPARHNQPIRLRLTSHGSLPMELQAIVDRTGAVPRDQLLVDCGGLVLPKLQLGNSKKLRLSLSPTVATLNISITLVGDKLSGDVQLVQKQVKITPTVGDELARLHLDQELAKTLGDVNSLATRFSLSGTLDAPQCKVWSNLGPAVSEAMDRALARAAASRAAEMIAQSQNRVNERLAELDRQISAVQSTLQPQLDASNEMLGNLGKSSTGHRLSAEHLGGRLPADSLFR